MKYNNLSCSSIFMACHMILVVLASRTRSIYRPLYLYHLSMSISFYARPVRYAVTKTAVGLFLVDAPVAQSRRRHPASL